MMQIWIAGTRPRIELQPGYLWMTLSYIRNT